MILKKGSIGDSVKEIQKILGVTLNGYFDEETEKSVMKFQKENNLSVDGIIGNKTYTKLIKFSTGDYNFIDNDGKLNDLGFYTTSECLKIYKSYLDTDEYVSDQGKTIKDTLFIHHTAGRGNPFKTVKNWNTDKRGRIATQYCIGRTSLKGDETNNGVVVETFPDEYFAWHLGKVGSKRMHTHSIGIELNNWGWLKKMGNKYYTYVNIEVPESQVYDLGEKFKGYRYYQKYTKEQIESLRLLIIEIKRRHPKIDLEKGLKEWVTIEDPITAFSFKDDAFNGKIKGVLTHTNVRKDKSDCTPQVMLVNILKNL